MSNSPQSASEPVTDAADLVLAAAAYEWLQHGHSGIEAHFARCVARWLHDKGFVED